MGETFQAGGSYGPSGTFSSSGTAEELPTAVPKNLNMKYACPVCGKEYYNRNDYRRHYMTHTGEKPFPCPHCPYRTRRMFNLKSHMILKHQEIRDVHQQPEQQQ